MAVLQLLDRQVHPTHWTQNWRACGKLDRIGRLLRGDQSEVIEDRGQSHSGLHQSESQSYAIPGSLSKGNIRIGMSPCYGLLGESLWVEYLWFRVNLRVVVDSHDRNSNHSSFLDDHMGIGDLVVGVALPPQESDNWVLAEGF